MLVGLQNTNEMQRHNGMILIKNYTIRYFTKKIKEIVNNFNS
jgi:hypothetical protein